MIYIEYEPNSLLYGESFFWFAISLFAPLHLAPNFKRTESEHAVKLLPFSTYLMRWVTQLLYVIIYVIAGVALQDRILAHLGVSKSDSLTYKIVAQTPTFFRIGLLFVTLYNMQDPHYNLWRLYDKLSTLSVGTKYQARTANWCLASILPDVLANACESVFILHFALSTDEFKASRLARLEPNARLWIIGFLYSYTVLTGLINMLIRYKPVLTLSYVGTCLSAHLELVSNQLGGERDEEAAAAAAAAVSLPAAKVKVISQQEPWSVDIYPTSAAAAVAAATDAGHGDFKRADRLRSSNGSLDQKAEIKVGNVAESKDKLFVISNLYELERHLTQVQLFCADVDRESPATVLAVTILNSVTFFYSLFYTSYHWDLVTISLAITFCLARTLPLAVMFFAGSRLELSARKINDKLEIIYLQERSQSLIYKQLASSHLSLARIFTLLRQIRLSCDNLMLVNRQTLSRCAFYIATVILIVIQYDSLISSTPG